MTIANYVDKTAANRITPGGQAVEKTTGKFTNPTETVTAIKIHVTKPDLREALPGGHHVASGDLIVHCDSSIGLSATDILEFWDDRWFVVVELRRYDVLAAALNHARKSFLVRKSGESDSAM